jgi:hypothetical protein
MLALGIDGSFAIVCLAGCSATVWSRMLQPCLNNAVRTSMMRFCEVRADRVGGCGAGGITWY